MHAGRATVVSMNSIPTPDGALTPDLVEAHLGQGLAAGLMFTASWCTAGMTLCRDLLGAENAKKRSPLVVVDIDTYPHVADRFQVKSLPTFILMSGQREQGRLLGAFSATQVRTLLERPLEPSPAKARA
jgi:thioredoxin-like negative regulator of GroEL